jgi:cell wall-associated NlpC family hydrolase
VAAAQSTSGGAGQGFSSNPSDIGTAPANLPAPSGGAAAAIAYARAQIGKPYVYAGTGPGAYDCSGLTMMAWAQGGVGMSHGSQSQWASFPKVPIPQLQPGDLVFFGSSGPSNHHVGIYIGGGTMIEAPHTGAYVRYASIYRPDLVSTGSRP